MKTDPAVDWVVCESDGDFPFRWGYSGGDLVAEWDGLLSLCASREGDLKAFRPAEGAPPPLVEKARRGIVRAFLRARRHQHSLHASAVSLEEKGLVCIGPSGLGKSSVAERMCRHAGVGLLSDDVTAIEVSQAASARVLPSESSVWLANATSETKTPRAQPPALEPVSLSCIVHLVFDDAASTANVRRIRGADAISALLPSIMRFERTSALWEREIDFATQLLRHATVFEARRSHEVAADAVAEALLGLLDGHIR